MPAIYGWAARDPGAARALPRFAYSTLFWCYSAIALSTWIYRIFIGFSDEHAGNTSFRATENLAGGNRPHRLESSHSSSRAARARLLHARSRAACLRTAPFAGSPVRDSGFIHVQPQRTLRSAPGIGTIGKRQRRSHGAFPGDLP